MAYILGERHKSARFEIIKCYALVAKPLLQLRAEGARLEKLVAKEQHMPLRVLARKRALVQKALAVPDVVGDVRRFLLRAQLAALHLHGDDFIVKRALKIGHKEDACQRNFERTLDTA